MTTEEIHSSLDKMLENPKAKNFLNHLVRAYMPISNVEKVIDKPEGEFKCALSKDDLISVQEILEGIQTEQFKSDLMKSMKTMFDDNADKTTAMAKLIGEKKLGVTGKGTTTYMSVPVAQEFFNWVITKSLKGDKHINWLLGNIRRESFVKRAQNITDDKVQSTVKKLEKRADRTATFTLGDTNGVLAQLKAKLENK
jgi:hypothetical protein